MTTDENNVMVDGELLDTLTEMEVSKALRELGVNRTRIIVAHRLSTIMNVDRIIVLKAGKKVEQGSFDDLVQKPNGLFRDMWQRQQRKEAGTSLVVDDDDDDDDDEVSSDNHKYIDGDGDGDANTDGLSEFDEMNMFREEWPPQSRDS